MLKVKQVMNSMKRREGEKRLAVLRMEVDYELATLYDAMNENDEETKNKCKQRLEKLRKELMILEA